MISIFEMEKKRRDIDHFLGLSNAVPFIFAFQREVFGKKYQNMNFILSHKTHNENASQLFSSFFSPF